MFIVFFISGLALNTSELKKALARESLPTVIFGFVMISLVTPILGFAMREIPLTPPAFSVGLTIFCLVRPAAIGVVVVSGMRCWRRWWAVVGSHDDMMLGCPTTAAT